ncbi:hypothetical protein AS203_07630 [Hoylesella enoeca]|uniref:Uncharacterized protein n=1 Tax=Hoylesella enoeca TaxID=76123 RepID=A0A0S2KLI0_9BACT|nr:hypothetical protein AS203_07630 [Hoylesella enoeca]
MKDTAGAQKPPGSVRQQYAALPIQEILEDHHHHNGCEFAAHLKISRRLNMKGKDRVVIYFADSYASWQKKELSKTQTKLNRKNKHSWLERKQQKPSSSLVSKSLPV